VRAVKASRCAPGATPLARRVQVLLPISPLLRGQCTHAHLHVCNTTNAVAYGR
jgi:hypothetical protein